MINPKITNCKDCSDILPLIDDINCNIFKMSLSAYNNIVYALNLNIDYSASIDLLHYKRILQYKLINPSYAGYISIEMIASKVKLLKYK